LKKYEDWQKYVKEQMDKNRQLKEPSAPTAPKRQVPSIDSDRFKIQRRGTAPEKAPQTQGRYQQAAVPGEPKTGSESERKSDKPSNQLTSPFVSVSDVWEAAERSTQSRKSVKEEVKPLQQKRLPGIERITKTPSASQENASSRQRSVQGESREDILERLVNPTITLEEAAKIMGICKATVRRYTAKGILPHYRTPGNQRRFKLNDIINFLENQRK